MEKIDMGLNLFDRFVSGLEREKRRNLDIGSPVLMMMTAVPGLNHGSHENLQKKKWHFLGKKQSKIYQQCLNIKIKWATTW